MSKNALETPDNNSVKYWKHRCLLAEKYIKETPCDPDIYDSQITAYQEWQKVKNEGPEAIKEELLIEKHLEGWNADPMKNSSIIHFAETGRVSGSFYMALKSMMNEFIPQ